MKFVEFAFILVIYGVIFSFLPARMQTLLYVPVNLLTTGVLLLWANKSAGLSLTDLGLTPRAAAGSAFWGSLIGVALGGLIFSVMAVFKTRFLSTVPQDFQSTGVLDLVYRVTVRIPFGTAAFEEVAFRGILLALFQQNLGVYQANILSSSLFGLWHMGLLIRVLPAAKLPIYSATMASLGTMTLAFLGGVIFAILRVKTSSLAGSTIAHWLINATATIALFRR